MAPVGEVPRSGINRRVAIWVAASITSESVRDELKLSQVKGLVYEARRPHKEDPSTNREGLGAAG